MGVYVRLKPNARAEVNPMSRIIYMARDRLRWTPFRDVYTEILETVAYCRTIHRGGIAEAVALSKVYAYMSSIE